MLEPTRTTTRTEDQSSMDARRRHSRDVAKSSSSSESSHRPEPLLDAVPHLHPARRAEGLCWHVRALGRQVGVDALGTEDVEARQPPQALALSERRHADGTRLRASGRPVERRNPSELFPRHGPLPPPSRIALSQINIRPCAACVRAAPSLRLVAISLTLWLLTPMLLTRNNPIVGSAPICRAFSANSVMQMSTSPPVCHAFPTPLVVTLGASHVVATLVPLGLSATTWTSLHVVPSIRCRPRRRR